MEHSEITAWKKQRSKRVVCCEGGNILGWVTNKFIFNAVILNGNATLYCKSSKSSSGIFGGSQRPFSGSCELKVVFVIILGHRWLFLSLILS